MNNFHTLEVVGRGENLNGLFQRFKVDNFNSDMLHKSKYCKPKDSNSSFGKETITAF